MFDFLTGITSAGMLITWSAICATYIRFRKAYFAQNIRIVEEAKSRLQPVLAWYGLVWALFLRISYALRSSLLSYFSGLFDVHKAQSLLVECNIILGCHTRPVDGDRWFWPSRASLAYDHTAEVGTVDLANSTA